MGWAESRRWMDIIKPGSQAESWFLGLEGNFAGTGTPGYPGQVHNPMGMGKDNMKEMQAKVRSTSTLRHLCRAVAVHLLYSLSLSKACRHFIKPHVECSCSVKFGGTESC
jgi:hypothetical protein